MDRQRFFWPSDTGQHDLHWHREFFGGNWQHYNCKDLELIQNHSWGCFSIMIRWFARPGIEPTWLWTRLGVAPALAALALSLSLTEENPLQQCGSVAYVHKTLERSEQSNQSLEWLWINAFSKWPPPHLICHKCKFFWQNVLKDSAFLLRASPSTTWTHHHVATSSLSIALPNLLR